MAYVPRTDEEVLEVLEKFFSTYPGNCIFVFLEIPFPGSPETYGDALVSLRRRDKMFCNHLVAGVQKMGISAENDPVARLYELLNMKAKRTIPQPARVSVEQFLEEQ